MFASTISNKPVATSQPISPQKQMIEFQHVPIKQVYHLSIFMLPNVMLDPEYKALVYYQIVPEKLNDGSGSQLTQNDFKLLGYLNAEKQSSIFKINPGNISIPDRSETHNEGDIDMESGISEADEHREQELVTIIIGISIETNETAMQQLDCLRITRNGPNTMTVAKATPSPPPVKLNQSDILIVSNKIIANAYNYLSSFTDVNNNVNIAKFNNWWDKFKNKMVNDPNYLQNLD